MNRTPSTLDVATGVATVLIAGLAIWVWTNGPTGPLPMHFNIQGEVDRWGDRRELAVVFGLLALICGALGGGMGLAARRADDPSRRRGLGAGQAIVVLTLSGVTGLIATSTLGGATTPAPSFLMVGVSALIAVIGAILGRVGPNPFVGVRTPWAYKSRLAWDRSNRLAGRLFLIIGLIGLAVSAITPQPLGLIVLGSAVSAAALWAVLESWRVWRGDPDRQPF